MPCAFMYPMLLWVSDPLSVYHMIPCIVACKKKEVIEYNEVDGITIKSRKVFCSGPHEEVNTIEDFLLVLKIPFDFG